MLRSIARVAEFNICPPVFEVPSLFTPGRNNQMNTIYKRVAGIDVHKEQVSCCAMIEGEEGKAKKEVRSYSTMSSDLESMKAWLQSQGITHIAMESTGVYWKPVYHILEGSFELILGNAYHIKNIPGRKTDVKDCEWIASLMRYGLIRGSFVPPSWQRELRDLTRYRVKLVQTMSAEKNRVNKVLEDTNVKLSCVVTDTFSQTGRRLLSVLLQGQQLNKEELKGLVHGHVKADISEIYEALQGKLTTHHRFMIQTHLNLIQHLTDRIAEIDQQIQIKLQPFLQEWELIKTIPGLDQVSAASVLAEIGLDMNQFPDAAHLASWAGICPGNNESAGKKKVSN
jgi:transposase